MNAFNRNIGGNIATTVSRSKRMVLISFLLLLILRFEAYAAIVAMEEKSGTAVESGSMLNVRNTGSVFVDKKNTKYELSPASAAEFTENGDFKLYRGSLLMSSSIERAIATSSARVDSIGKVLVSYDFKEKSTSIFVISGEARLSNPVNGTNSLRLDAFQGATFTAGETIPSVIQGLTPTSVQSWLKGYGWTAEKVQSLTAGFPNKFVAQENKEIPEHIKNAKLADYFSGIQVGDDLDVPDYYIKKFQDPDQAVAELNHPKVEVSGLTPEDAALIALPNTQIDLDLDLPITILSAKKKSQEIENLEAERGKPTSRGRGLASASEKARKLPRAPRAIVPASQNPEVDAVLDRLKILDVERKSAYVPGKKQIQPSSRGPASAMNDPGEALITPKTVYWENF